MLAPLTAAPQDGPARKDGPQEPAKDVLQPVPQPPGPGGGIFIGPGGPGGAMGRERKVVKEYDKDGDGRLNNEERQAAREALKKERAAGGGRGGPGGRVGFGPGNFLTKPLLEATDADKDGKLTRDELAAGAKKFIAEFDKDKKGSLEEAQIAEALNRAFPRPQGFPGGPPGGGPPGPPPGGGPPGPPPGGGPGRIVVFGPGGMLAGGIVQRADANKDKKVTLDELTAAGNTLFKEADKDKDGKLDDKELGEGVALLMPAPGFGPGGRGREPAKPGPRVAPADVKSYPDASLYEPTVLRTLFLDFENKDWEAELADFTNTDVEVPATLTGDGKKYPNVGVHFRGMSSLFGVAPGHKRSLNVAVDFVDAKQRLLGYKTLNLLNAHEDPSFLSTVLYSHLARQHIAAPKANLVKVVINGESWGLYVNAQQFNREFVAENFKTGKGARWKAGGPGGGSLDYLGENVEDYRRRYEIKSADDTKSWKALIALCRTLNQTPPTQLEEALKPILDVEGALWFLALDAALINNDGYWARASDYSLYRDDKGKFHVIPHDMNEAFHGAMGFGFGGPGGRGPGGRPFVGPPTPGGPGGGAGPMPRPGGVELDPLVGLDDARKPLRSRLLAVPGLKARYLRYVRTIAEEGLDWKNLGPVVAQYRSLVEKEVEADTRKLSSYDAFKRAVSDAAAAEAPQGRPAGLSLRAFADQRRKYLLNHSEVKKAAP